MSRQELADIANQLMSVKDPDGPMTENFIGKIEQGRTAYPRAGRRAALRAALGGHTDAEIGLFNKRRRPTDGRAGECSTSERGCHSLDLPHTSGSLGRQTLKWANDGTNDRIEPLRQQTLDALGEARLALVGSAMSELAPGWPADDHVPWPCATTDGRIVYVLLPRRAVLAGFAGVALRTAAAPPVTTGQTTWGATAATSRDFTPVEAFRGLRAMLVDQDNIAGPAHVLPTVEHQLRVIQGLRLSAGDADRRALLGVQAEYAEFAGWLAQDLGKFESAEIWLSRALGWAHSIGNRSMVTYILARKSQLAGDMADPLAAIDMANAARESSSARGRLAAASSAYGAYGYALAGDAQGMDRAIKTAREQLHDADEDPDPADRRWAPWLDTAYIEVQAGRCHAELGQHDAAINAYQGALDSLPPTYRRDRGVYLARQAIAHATAGDSSQAGTVALQAAGIAFATGSHRIMSELVRVHGALATLPRAPAADQFTEAFRGLLPRAA